MGAEGESHRYRPGATIIPLFCWAVLTGVSSYYVLEFGTQRAPSDQAKWLAYLIGAFGILFGPVAFLAHFIRLCLVTVTVVPDEGLLFGSGRKVKWLDIRSIEHKDAAFKGLLRVSPAILFLTAGCMAIVYFVVLPSFALFTPWHSRVVVVLKDGQQLVLRDLAHADRFIAEVSGHLKDTTTPKS